MSKDCSLLFVVVVIHKSGWPHKRFVLLFIWKSERGFSQNAKPALNVVSNRSIYWRQDFPIQCIDCWPEPTLFTCSPGCRLILFVIGLQTLLISFIQSRPRFSNNLLYVSSLSVDSTHMRRDPLLLHFFFFIYSVLYTLVQPSRALCDVKNGIPLIPLPGWWSKAQPSVGFDNFQNMPKVNYSNSFSRTLKTEG